MAGVKPISCHTAISTLATMVYTLLCCWVDVPVTQAQGNFIETSVGVGFHSIDLGETEAISTTEYLSLSTGIELQHTLNLAGSFRIWSTEEESNQDNARHVLFHDFHFTGVSVGVDAQLFTPSLAQGPYIKAGRHCWAANVSEVFNIWDGNGCSNLVGGGVLWKNGNAERGAFFTEVLLTRFKYVNTWMLAFGYHY